MNWIFRYLFPVILAANQAESQHTIHVFSEVQSRFATTQVGVALKNERSLTADIVFQTVIPKNAFISNFTMEAGGRTLLGEVRRRDEAVLLFWENFLANRTAGIVSLRSKLTKNQFEITVSVPPRSSVSLVLTYQEVLERRGGFYRHFIHVPSKQEGYKEVLVDVLMTDINKIKKIHFPVVSLKNQEKTNDQLVAMQGEQNGNVISHSEKGSSLAFVNFERTNDEGGDMVLLYDLEHTEAGGTAFVMNGHFIHFISPDYRKKGTGKWMDQNVVFVLDKSGSMRDAINNQNKTKFDQMKEGVEEMLKEIRSSDKFSVVMFSSNIEVWNNRSQPGTEANKKDVMERFMPRTRKGGGTDIHSGLLEAFKILRRERKRPPSCSIFFLTDGKANLGKTTVSKEILEEVEKANVYRCELYTVGFGGEEETNFPFLKQLAEENRGFARIVYPDSDADFQLKGLFREIAHVQLSGVKVSYVRGRVDTNSIVRNLNDNVHVGEEMIVTGKASDSRRFRGVVRANDGSGKRISARPRVLNDIPCQMPIPGIPAEVIEKGVRDGVLCERKTWSRTLQRAVSNSPETGKTKPSIRLPFPPTQIEGFVEYSFAHQTVKRLLEKSDMSRAEERRAIEMALRYNLVTKHTSMVIAETMPLFDPWNSKGREGRKKEEAGMIREKACINRRIKCALHSQEVCKGRESYMGDKSTTVSGVPCQRWDSQTPHSHQHDPEAHNLCRNIDGRDEAPWCYTTDPDLKWDYCFPDCQGSSKCRNKADSCNKMPKDYCEKSNEHHHWMKINCCEICENYKPRISSSTPKTSTTVAKVMRKSEKSSGNCKDKYSWCTKFSNNKLACRRRQNILRCPKSCNKC